MKQKDLRTVDGLFCTSLKGRGGGILFNKDFKLRKCEGNRFFWTLHGHNLFNL